jgi:hypothetical protein
MAAIKNRRRGPDTMVKMITAFNMLSWLIIGIAIILYITVNPIRNSDYFNQGGGARGGIAIIGAKLLLFFNVILCIWGMVVNMMRNKRKSDRFRVSLIISMFVSLGAFILLLLFM